MPGTLMAESNEGETAAHRLTETSAGASNGEERTGRSFWREKDEKSLRQTETIQLPSPSPSHAADEPFPVLEIFPPITATAVPRNAELNNEDNMNNGAGNGVADAGANGARPRPGHDGNSSTVASAAFEEASDQPTQRKASDTTRARAPSATKRDITGTVRKLSASQMQALTTSPESLPVAIVTSPPPAEAQRKPNGAEYPLSASLIESNSRSSMAEQLRIGLQSNLKPQVKTPTPTSRTYPEASRVASDGDGEAGANGVTVRRRPGSSRTVSTPPINRVPSVSQLRTVPHSTRRNSFNPAARPPPLNLNTSNNLHSVTSRTTIPRRPEPSSSDNPESFDTPSAAPIQHTEIPLPPMSLHTHLQLELAGVRPSPLYIYRHQSADTPYESSAVKFERLLNALLLPPFLEATLTFGALACLDAFLYTFTLLPLRFCIAIGVLVKWWLYILWKEVRWVMGFVWHGIWRLWGRSRRGRKSSRPSRDRTDSSLTASEAERSRSRPRENGYASDATSASQERHRLNGNGGMRPPKHAMPSRPTPAGLRHRRSKSMPSNLTPYHKADLLQGFVIVCSSVALMSIDASRMYHFIRAQSAMKLYVIYNLLEVGDRLLAAIGQDILECLFSSETLSRNSLGRSKILLPFGMFLLSLAYNVAHAVVLFYQVITLNVAVNSYSNALLSLLMSNQFVEIKGSVFKKIEKENLFQLTCSDVVERFQLWIILIIIGMRNIVEVGGLSVPGAGSEADGGVSGPGPIHSASSLPNSFTLLPSWLFSGEVLSPFLIVIGSEMCVDWIKHAYINKFNNVKPTIYKRMLDIFCKDYYTNAFGAPALTRRIGLPLLPLSCLFIRASLQTYNMFLATHLPPPIPTTTTELSLESALPSSPAMIAALDRLDNLIRNALGRAVYGVPYSSPDTRPFWSFSSDDVIALLTMVTFFFLIWLVLLVIKLILGMALLKYSRNRYSTLQQEERAMESSDKPRDTYFQPGKRIGGWGMAEIGDDRRKVIYQDDPEGLKKMRDREKKGEQMASKMEIGNDGLEKVTRYEMIAKRIW